MKKMRRWRCLRTIGFILALAGLSGCNTWTYSSGMTLPSKSYLQHPPQYIAPSPDFPLQNELATMQMQQLAGPGAALGAAPPPVPGVGGP